MADSDLKSSRRWWYSSRWLVAISITMVAAMILAVAGQGEAMAKTNSGIKETTDPQLRAAYETIEKKAAKIEADRIAEIKKNLSGLEQQWGIRIEALRATAGGYMLDMRLRVLDKEKAFPLLGRHVKRYVVVEKSGAVLRIPFTAKVGSLRATVRTANMVKTNRIYGSLFANPGQHVKPGDKVTLVIGNFMAEKITVQ